MKKKSKMGRPTKYHEGMPNKLREYFNISLFDTVEEEVASQGRAVTVKKVKPCIFPTFEGFCWQENLNHSTLHEWCKKHHDFSVAYMECKDKQKEILITHALTGGYNAAFSKFLAINVTDLKETIHQQIDQTTIQINIDQDDSEL